jgi:hypothetical protein
MFAICPPVKENCSVKASMVLDEIFLKTLERIFFLTCSAGFLKSILYLECDLKTLMLLLRKVNV